VADDHGRRPRSQLLRQAGDRFLQIGIVAGDRQRPLEMRQGVVQTAGPLVDLAERAQRGQIVRRALADLPIVVRSDYIPRIQEVQASIYHVMRETQEILGRV